MFKKVFSVVITVLIPCLIFGGFTGDKVERKVYTDNVKQWMQVVKFSHKFHIQEVGAECTDCHKGVEESKASDDFLIPKESDCFDCHDKDETPCENCHVNPQKPGTFEIPVRKINFTHELHIKKQKLQCSNCHIGVENIEYADTRNLPSMESCFNCHNNRVASNECELCHKEIATLLPSSHEVVDFKTEHKKFVRAIGAENQCSSCHQEDFCQECHDANIALFTPQVSGKKNLVLQRVHELNYIYTHPIDAKGKEKDCYVCHDRKAFCVNCHTSKEKPSWHSGSDFVTLGVGSGGGRHAEYARRDIEMCTECHDVEGADPICVICHVDRTPGLGNDPKTHPEGFMKNVEGAWHSDEGAICFTCHINTGTPGVGFCGYCHGSK